MADGTIELTGKSGTKYQFNIWPRSTKFKPAEVIYVMAKKKDATTYTIIYIGQTGDLSVRPLNHHKTDCFDKHKADTLFIRTTPGGEKARLKVESDLIDAYNPPCNG